MQVKLSEAKALFAACGFAKRVDEWPSERVEKKLNQMDQLVDNGKKLKDPKLNTLLRDVLNAVDDEKAITLLDDTKAKPGKPAAKPDPKAGKKKAPPPPDDEDDEDDEDSELEDDDDGEEELGADEEDEDAEDEDDDEGEEEDGDSADDDSDEDEGGVGEDDDDIDEDDEDEPAPPPKKKPVAKPQPKKGTAKAVVEDDEDEDEDSDLEGEDEDSDLEGEEEDPDGEDSDDSEIDESDDDDEEDEVAPAAPARKKPTAKAGTKQPAAKAAKKGDKLPNGKTPPGNLGKRQVGKSGMTKIEYMVHVLTTKASKDKPLSKKQVLDAMCREFGEEQREAMTNTVGSQIPNRLVVEKRVAKVVPVGNGYYAVPLAKKKAAK